MATGPPFRCRGEREFGRKPGTPPGRRPSPERPETRRAPSRAHLSAADLQVYLRGIDYPAEGRVLLCTRRRTTPRSVVDVIEQFGDRTYRSAAEVSEEFGRKRHEPPARTETVAERQTVKAPAHLSAADLQVYLKGWITRQKNRTLSPGPKEQRSGGRDRGVRGVRR